jgi:hydrogenase maturation factor
MPVVTALGTADAGISARTADLKCGMDIVAAKWIGMEGTAILAEERKSELSKRFPSHFIEQALALGDGISIQKEARIAIDAGVTVMHDASEGGIFAALWEMASASGVGIDIDLKKIPIRQETVEISEFFGINPYRLMSGGCLLFATYDGEGLVRKLNDESTNSAIIGRAVEGNDRIVTKDDEKSFLELPQADEIYSII